LSNKLQRLWVCSPALGGPTATSNPGILPTLIELYQEASRYLVSCGAGRTIRLESPM
jgi:hypothetical protein